MANRYTGTGRSGPERTTPASRGGADERGVNRGVSLRIVRSDVRDEEILSTIEQELGGGDPYNSTGRFMVEKIRERAKEQD